jgi:hypothetical protein
MKPKLVTLGDKNLREAVEQQLDYDPAVPSNNVGVLVSDGVVSLSGYVETYADKIIAEKAVKRVRGVKAVANDIEVRPPSEFIKSLRKWAAILHPYLIGLDGDTPPLGGALLLDILLNNTQGRSTAGK